MANETKPIRVRLAPSPTGPLHVGTARTALFNWLFARQNSGAFILRIEDTDTARSKKEYELELIEGLRWLGLEWDEGPANDGYAGDYGPYRQSERGDLYEKYLQKLFDEGKAYFCYCTKEDLEAERQAMMAQGLPPKYGGHCRNLVEPPKGKEPQVIRFKMPEVKVEFKDLVRGTVTFDASLFGDVAIAKDMRSPLHHLAVVVDDEEMNISHVIRGEDLLSNTPRQILLQKALGFREPTYAHLPLILNADRSKLSKRFAETSLLDYKKQGYLPEAVVNFCAFLGWHPKGEKEVFSPEELIQEFDIKRIQKAGAVFDIKKLEWLQKKHLEKLSDEEIVSALSPFLEAASVKTTKEFLQKVVRVERDRITTLHDFIEAANFFFALPDYPASLLVWQKDNWSKVTTLLKSVVDILEGVENFTKDEMYQALTPLIEKEGRGSVLWPTRAALSGLPASPDPLAIAEVLGPEEVLKRMHEAIKKLEHEKV